MQLGRLQVIVPDVSSDVSTWALPVLPLGSAELPESAPIGAAVWIAFENDDPDYPVVIGLLPQ